MAAAAPENWTGNTALPPAPLPNDDAPSAGLRLHHKGMLVLLALAGLIAMLIGLVLAYRSSMEQDFERLERARRAGVVAAELAQTQALALAEIGGHLGSGLDVVLDPHLIERILSQLAAQAHALRATGTGEAIDLTALNQARADFAQRPDRVALLALRSQLQSAVDALGRQSRAREQLTAAQVTTVYERGRAVAVALAAAAVLGTALIGVVVVFFFARLATDIGKVHARAMAVVGGDRSARRTIDRDDELGELGEAMDVTVAALAARERDLEIERRNAFHREKMATIGALAAGVLNDIGNPIAAIDGFARAMRDERDAGGLRFDNALCDPEHILAQTTRLQFITRQISQLAAPPSSQPQLLSLNDMVNTAVLLAHFDPRVGDQKIETELDPQLPAVDGVGDRLVQVVLNLLVNAADATRGQDQCQPLIVVKTSRSGDQLQLSIADNGRGMDTLTSTRALHSTAASPSAWGSGLGLPQCRQIAEQHGGTLRIVSAPGQGTTAILELPMPGVVS